MQYSVQSYHPYRKGQSLTEEEAKIMNILFQENLRNNTRSNTPDTTAALALLRKWRPEASLEDLLL